MNSTIVKNKFQDFLFAFAAAVFLFSCQKQTAKTSAPPAQASENAKGSKTLDYLARMKSMMDKNAARINSQLKDNQAQMASTLRNVENIKTARLQIKPGANGAAVLSTSNLSPASIKSVVNVPGDFSNLQDAINYYFLNAPNGGKVIIKGTITISSDIAVDVPNLSIQGTGAATINGANGSAIQLLAKGIELSHLNLNVNIVINSGASNANLHEDIISSTASTGANMLIAIHGASYCRIDNSTIQEGATASNTTGVFSDGGCTGNEFGNDKFLNFATSLQDFGPPFGPFYTSGVGLQLMGDLSTVIRNCIFDNNVTAINFFACAKASVDNTSVNINQTAFGNAIIDQPITDAGGNILASSSGTQLSNCAVNPNVAVAAPILIGFGIALTSTSNPVLTNCSVIYVGNAISLTQCTNAKLANNIADHNETGIADLGSAGTAASNSTCSDNQFFGLLISEAITFLPSDYISITIAQETNSVFENNKCNSNGLDGITLIGTTGCTLRNCTANSNARWGIEVEQVNVVLNIPPYNQFVTVPSTGNKVISNTARNNTAFDYMQIQSTSLTFANNNFGTTSIN